MMTAITVFHGFGLDFAFDAFGFGFSGSDSHSDWILIRMWILIKFGLVSVLASLTHRGIQPARDLF